jgi:hypothetical protein
MRQDQGISSTVGEVSYVIDLSRSRQMGRSPEHMLFERRCAECKARLAKAAELPPAERQIREIARCCSRKEGFISTEMPLLEIAFLVLVARRNQPIDLRELYHIVTEEWATPLNPKNITLEGFRRILDNDRYYGFRALSGEPG